MNVLVNPFLQHVPHPAEEIRAVAVLRGPLFDVDIDTRIYPRLKPEQGEYAIAEFLNGQFPVVQALHLLQSIHQFHKVHDVASRR